MQELIRIANMPVHLLLFAALRGLLGMADRKADADIEK